MYWAVGMSVGIHKTEVNVHPAALSQSNWESAVEYALDMAQSLYPNERIEFEFVKEYDNG